MTGQASHTSCNACSGAALLNGNIKQATFQMLLYPVKEKCRINLNVCNVTFSKYYHFNMLLIKYINKLLYIFSYSVFQSCYLLYTHGTSQLGLVHFKCSIVTLNQWLLSWMVQFFISETVIKHRYDLDKNTQQTRNRRKLSHQRLWFFQWSCMDVKVEL